MSETGGRRIYTKQGKDGKWGWFVSYGDVVEGMSCAPRFKTRGEAEFAAFKVFGEGITFEGSIRDMYAGMRDFN